ncbi:MAG: Bax inhibitor-1/YccA family protein [Epsilonproteobacteria bacterium]|nr:Bax inhibitor-1/YccA family protein [Campylobacterota bacterium]
MALYDRDYVKNNTVAREEQEIQTRQGDLASFIKATYQLFAATMISGAAGAYVGIGIAGVIAANYWWIAIPWMLFGMFGLTMVKDKSPINYIVLFAFTFVGGIIMAPLLSNVLGMNGGGTLVANAFITTSVIFGALSIYAMNSKSDFSSWGKPLMIALLIVIVASLLNIFVFKSPIMHVIMLAGIVLLMSGFVLFDTQNIIRGAYSTPIEGAFSLYLNFFNMFTAILQMFGIFGGDD